jgi:hypothetical protein
MYDYLLKEVQTFEDLGIIISNNLSWTSHVQDCIKRANQRIGYIKRTLGYNMSSEIKLHVYKLLVRPILEYATLVWAQPYNKHLLSKIENVQRKMSKYILQDYESNYKQRLLKCDILPLSYRREYLDLVFTYNYFNKLVDADLGNLLEIHDENIIPLRYGNYNKLLRDQSFRTETYRNFFSIRIVRLWNGLPQWLRDIELSEGMDNIEFKRSLKKYLFEKLSTEFKEDNTCTWVSNCYCASCRPM